MKRASSILVVLASATLARAETAVGVGAAILARQQASGSEVVTVSPQLRVHYTFAPFLLAAGTYDFAYLGAPTGWGMRHESHQVSLRAVGRLRLTHALLDFELGPSLRFDHSSVIADSRLIADHQTFRPGVTGALFVGVPIERFELRLGSEVVIDARWDLRFTVGLLWRTS